MSLLDEGPRLAAQAQDVISGKAVASGTAGTLAAVAPPETYGEFLTTNGFLVLSYAEWIQVVGAVWVVCLIADFALRMIRRVKSGRFWA